MSTDVWSYYVDINTKNSKIHSYFSAVQARFWTFEHYINWICEGAELPVWTTCIEQFYESLHGITKIKAVPLSVRAYVKSLVEIMNEAESQGTMEAIEMTYLALIKERQGKNLSMNLLHAQANKKAYANATGVVGSKRNMNKKKNSEQKKRRTDNSDDEEAMEGSGLSEDTLDKSELKEKAVLPISETIPDDRRAIYSEDSDSSSDSDYVEGRVERQSVAKTQSTDDIKLNEIEDGQIDLTKFEETFLAMDPEIMWTLKSGRKVEKVVYEFAKNLCGESYLHLFIINDMDVETKSLFSLNEWNEIFEIKNRPKLDPCHAELLKKYTVNDVKKLKSLLLEPFLPNGEEYNREIHFVLDFINNAYRGILRLWEMRKDPFDDLKLEGWHQINVWSRLIDPGFDDMNINVIRGEGMSVASSERKNIKRKLNERKKFGKKGDGIFRLHKGRLEYGAIEAGRKWEGTNGTKYMTDSLKISKMLKDMLDKLITECNHLVHELKVLGILHGANRLQVLTVDHPQGYITRIYRNKVQEVAGRLTNAKPLALVLKEILYARSIITATMNLIDKKDDLNIETFLLDDDNDDGSCTSFTNTVTKTFTTPKKLSAKDMIMKLRNNNII